MKHIRKYSIFESDSWSEKDSLVKKFKFKSFSDALEFINLISIESEKINHHPDIKWNYDKIEISLKTHDKGKITELDYNLSRKIDDIYNEKSV
jgi:4a-hydroxytetrahydrobiopterin dehydratase